MYDLSNMQPIRQAQGGHTTRSKSFNTIFKNRCFFDVFISPKQRFLICKDVCISYGKHVGKTMDIVHNLCTKFASYNPRLSRVLDGFFFHFSYPAFTIYRPHFGWLIFGLKTLKKYFVHISPPFNNNNHLNINIIRI